jgi:hypothetical protein
MHSVEKIVIYLVPINHYTNILQKVDRGSYRTSKFLCSRFTVLRSYLENSLATHDKNIWNKYSVKKLYTNVTVFVRSEICHK